MSQKYKCSLVYTTFPSIEKAQELARIIIEKKHARCINIIPKVLSIYEWDSKVIEETECSALFKTSSEKTEKLINFLRLSHPYKTPAILKWETETYQEFGNYICPIPT